eukprot:TRINITY_DN41_c4_g1_i1.p1 TRINITY_DN41_c4_g1~~TRINITY_DN41_c4_g1_i1.p1  ORF type:complete len:329 (+),score=156.21 TRINITY_DN41_c4_g1_i1:104-1090(+)
MKILVTGGAGFIGSHTALKLLERGDEIVIIDEVNNYYDISIKEENLELFKKYGNQCKVLIEDICNKSCMEELFNRENFEVICHLAARAGVRPSIEDPFIYIHSNIEGTVVLLELARKYRIKNFVMASSSSVYGNNVKAPFNEEDIVNCPVSPYAATKRSCELLAYTYFNLYKFPIACLRFFTVYGPRGRPDMAPFIFIDSIYRGVPIKQFGDGSSRRDYTFIDDIVSGVISSIDNPQGYQIYNLGRGETIQLTEFIQVIEQTLNKKAIIQIFPEQPGDVPLTFADVSKATNQLGYRPSISTRQGIQITVDWYLSKYANKQNNNNNNNP